MAVINDYVQTQLALKKLAAALESTGSELRQIIVTFETAAADDNGSVYRIAKAVSPDMVLVDAKIANDATAGFTDADLGLYEPLDSNGGAGAVVSKDCFLNAGDLSSAHVSGSELSAMSAVDVANRAKPLYLIAGHTQVTKKAAYDICLTANAAASAIGTITVILTFAQSQG